MAKEATLQVRMEASLKEQVESLYKDLGTSFAEAVRIFARQSIEDCGMPFQPKRNSARIVNYVSSLPEVGYLSQDGMYVLPADWDDEEDDIYEQLV